MRDRSKGSILYRDISLFFVFAKELVFHQFAQNVSDRDVRFLNPLSRLSFDDQRDVNGGGEFSSAFSGQRDRLEPQLPSRFNCPQNVRRVAAGGYRQRRVSR